MRVAQRKQRWRELAARSNRAAGRVRQKGMVLLTVLFVLLGLLVLSAPFLSNSRDATRQGALAADRAQAGLTLQGAAQAARARLGQSHPALDATPDSDSYQELLGAAQSFELPGDGTLLWGVQVSDESGRIDLNSASPGVLANVLGWQTRLSEVLPGRADEARVSDAGRLHPEGGVLITGGEWIQYGRIDTQRAGVRLLQLTRGVEATKVGDEWQTYGPLPPRGHAFGTPMIDQRVYAVLDRRILRGLQGQLHRYDVMEELREVPDFAREPMLGIDWMEAVAGHFTTYVDQGTGPRWQRAERLVNEIQAGETIWITPEVGRYYAPGTTIRVQGEGRSELRYVTAVNGGRFAVNRVFENDYFIESATVQALVRRPVNLNTADPKVLQVLFENVALRGNTERVTRQEAVALTAAVLEKRPFAHREGFLRRVLLPAAGLELDPDAGPATESDEEPVPYLSVEDALALYLNGLNANDSSLAFSTMPFAFTSKDVYRMHLNASVQTENGLERAFRRREQVERVVPQRPLLALFHRQEDFEKGLVLDRDAPLWMTGPEATNPFDGGNTPPSRAFVHMGTRQGRVFIPGLTTQTQPTDEELAEDPIQHVYADREENGWAGLWPSREGSTPSRRGRMMHFDFETSDPEGRSLIEQPLIVDPADSRVGWVASSGPGLLPGIAVSFWMRMVEPSLGPVMDLNHGDPRTNRIALRLLGTELELSVLDHYGDHPATVEEEVTKVTVPISQTGPSVAPGTWGHVSLSILGNRPSQIDFQLDGQNLGVTYHGMTRTTAPVSITDSLIPVESTEGFPEYGVARVGSELVEYRVQNANSLVCEFNESGPLAGFGGRLARHRRELSGDPSSPPVGLGSGFVSADHGIGTLVEIYGYSMPIREPIPSGQGQLVGDVGPFRVARVMDVGENVQPDAIIPEGTIGLSLLGLESGNIGPIQLALADHPLGDPDGAEVMKGFHAAGGYALLLQGWGGTQFGTGLVTAAPNGTRIGGVEVIRYSGISGNELIIAQRGAHAELGIQFLDGPRAFIIDFGGISDVDGNELDNQMVRSVFCIPISVPVQNANVFPQSVGGTNTQSGPARFAQITHTTSGELTEWIRYDRVQATHNQLVRIDEPMVNNLSALLGIGRVPQVQNPQPGQSQAVSSAGSGSSSASAPGASPLPEWTPPSAGPLGTQPPSPSSPDGTTPGQTSSGSSSSGQGVSANVWTTVLGQAETPTWALTQSVSDLMRFRGVADTNNQSHPGGTLVVPVFRIDLGYGQLPGAQDAVFLDAGPQGAGGVQTNLVHRAFTAPLEDNFATANHTDVDGVAQAGNPFTGEYPVEEFGTYVGLGAGLATPISPGQGTTQADDLRLLPRMVKFPSGERPTTVDRVVLGRDATASSGTAASGGAVNEIPAVVIDEMVYGTKEQGNGLVNGFQAGANMGSGLILAADLNETETTLGVQSAIATPRGPIGTTLIQALRILDRGMGLARIGDEIVCYTGVDVQTGVITLAAGGRGLLGTTPAPHELGAVLYPMNERIATVLVADLTAEEDLIPVWSTAEFPDEGTLLIGQELVHYTRKAGNSFWMPRASLRPGAQDGGGLALFRGRYGTAASAHAADTPVILFPFRYWDRWEFGADVPELAYLGLRVDQSSAYFEGAAFRMEPPPYQGVRLEALLRADPSLPWDADPFETDGLFLLDQGKPDDTDFWPLEIWSDALEARVYVQYEPGAIDLLTGSAHGWKFSPKLRQYAVSFDAPSETLRSVDR